MSSNMGTAIMNRELKMLVLVFLILNTADFCHSKAFPEEAEKASGKRYYNYDQNIEFRQTYEPQINAEHWMPEDFYQPRIDGQPIYVPALDRPGSYNEFLDAFYKAYTPAWNLETPVPTYSINNAYKGPDVLADVPEVFSDKKHNSNYALPTSKESKFNMEMSSSESNLPESDNVPEDSNENSHLVTTELKDIFEFENPVIHKLLKKKDELSKTTTVKYNQYDQPIIVKTIKQKPKTNNAKKGVYKTPSIPKTKPQSEVYQEYKKPLVYKVKVKPNKKRVTQMTKYGDLTSQATRKKSKGKRRKQYSKPSKPRISEQAGSNENVLHLTTVDVTSEEQNSSSDKLIKEEETALGKTNLNKPVKTKEKVVVNDAEYESVRIIQKVPAKQDSKAKPVKTNKKSVKTNRTSKPEKVSPQNQPVKTEEKEAIKQNIKEKPVKTNGKVNEKIDLQYHPVQTKEKVNVNYNTEHEKIMVRKQLNQNDKDFADTDMDNGDSLDYETNFTGDMDMTESALPIKLNSDESFSLENYQNSETSSNVMKESNLNIPDTNDFRGLSSMNSNVWSMLFNPNSEQNRLKQKRCITRNNETGFCTFIQNCDVPQIAASLEQLLNNACVIDDIFIGVCCPEFPVETVKVNWDQTLSDFDNQMEDGFDNNPEDCGIKSNEATKLQSWPWKAQLVSMSNGKIFCGGVLVSEDHVLTAAHCTTKIPKNQILVRLGQYDDSSGDDYAVVEIKRHAQYNSRTMHNDIALLKLGRRVMSDAHIGTVCLPDEDHKNDHNGETGTLLGWRGIFGTKSNDPEFLEIISNKDCENKVGMKVSSTLLCTETRKESERTCNADSGAPLVIEDDGKFEVIGILGWDRNDCNQRFPSTFSRVSSYTGWIKTHLM